MVASDKSQLTLKLEQHQFKSLAVAPEKKRWHIITEYIEEMYELLYENIAQFTPAAFKMFEDDLSAIIKAIVDNPPPPKFDPKPIDRLLKACRVNASDAADWLKSKEPALRTYGKTAIVDLQTNLNNALEHIRPINNELNPLSETNMGN